MPTNNKGLKELWGYPLIDEKARNAISDTRSSLENDFQKKTDDTLGTVDKTVPGAINEIKNNIDNIGDNFTSEQSETKYDMKYNGKSIGSIGIELKDNQITGGDGSFNIDLTPYQTKTDTSLTTNDKTISGAIKELNTQYKDIVNGQIPSEYLEKSVDTYISNNNSGLATKIDIDNLPFIVKEQFLNRNNYLPNGVWNIDSLNGLTVFEVSTCSRHEKIYVKRNTTYNFKNIYGYFCLFFDLNNKFITRLTEDQATSLDLSYTPSQDGYMYISILTDNKNTCMMTNSDIPNKYVYGKYEYLLDTTKSNDFKQLLNAVNCLDIIVKKDGTGNFTKVNDALEYAKTLNKKVNINIYSGEYDVLEELGGQTWIDSLTDANGERQGLQLYDNVKLIGHGNVIIKLIMPDSITKQQSTLISTINTFGNGGFENIHFIAKNTRYVCHDEMNNQTHNINRYVNNCIFEHLGNKETLWEYYTAYGCGTGSNCYYKFENTQFYSPYRPFCMHNNSNQEPCTLIMNRIIATGGSWTNSVEVTSFGTNHNGNSKAYISNCKTDKPIAKRLESPDSEDSWDLFDFD